MLQMNLHYVSVGFPWLLLSQPRTSIGRWAPALFFIRLLINSAYTACNIIELSMRPVLWTVTLVISSMPEESRITFLHLSWKFHLTKSPTTDFSTNSIHALPQVTDHFWWSAKRQGRGPSLFHLCSLLWLFSAQESKGQFWSWAWI